MNYAEEIEETFQRAVKGLNGLSPADRQRKLDIITMAKENAEMAVAAREAADALSRIASVRSDETLTTTPVTLDSDVKFSRPRIGK